MLNLGILALTRTNSGPSTASDTFRSSRAALTYPILRFLNSLGRKRQAREAFPFDERVVTQRVLRPQPAITHCYKRLSQSPYFPALALAVFPEILFVRQ